MKVKTCYYCNIEAPEEALKQMSPSMFQCKDMARCIGREVQNDMIEWEKARIARSKTQPMLDESPY